MDHQELDEGLDVGLADVFQQLKDCAVEQVVACAVLDKDSHEGLQKIALENDAGVELDVALYGQHGAEEPDSCAHEPALLAPQHTHDLGHQLVAQRPVLASEGVLQHQEAHEVHHQADGGCRHGAGALARVDALILDQHVQQAAQELIIENVQELVFFYRGVHGVRVKQLLQQVCHLLRQTRVPSTLSELSDQERKHHVVRLLQEESAECRRVMLDNA
mmetsp:Transcript_8094/g.21555  ORF Transcript_8094/g.21555 Transcript_8094/m.21555 type:complete len:218 (+) Transcript_8094:469-1122(+)